MSTLYLFFWTYYVLPEDSHASERIRGGPFDVWNIQSAAATPFSQSSRNHKQERERKKEQGGTECLISSEGQQMSSPPTTAQLRKQEYSGGGDRRTDMGEMCMSLRLLPEL